MKVITAFIKHFRVNQVCLALSKLDITGITITEVKGFGRPRGTEFFPGDESVVNFLPRIRLEVGVASDQVERTVAAIKAAVRTGQIGDEILTPQPVIASGDAAEVFSICCKQPRCALASGLGFSNMAGSAYLVT